VGTEELFFKSGNDKLKFQEILNNPNSAVSKVLDAFYKSKEGRYSFSLAANAEPGQGANWIFKTEPESIKLRILTALKADYKNYYKEDLDTVVKKANDSAKKGSGSGLIDPVNGIVDIAPAK